MALRFAVDHPEFGTCFVLIGSGWSGKREAKNDHRASGAHEQHDSVIPWIKETVGEGYFADDSYGFAMSDLTLTGKDTRALALTLAGMPKILGLPEEAV